MANRRLLFHLFVMFAVLFQFQNCGNPEQKSTIAVKFPEQLKQSKLEIKRPQANGSQAPTEGFDFWNDEVGILSTTDINCFGIAIGGPDAGLQNARCEDTAGDPINFGVSAMGRALGEQVNLEVDAGPGRVINVIAWKADDTGACQSLQDGSAVQGDKLSRPHLIAQVTRDLNGGTEVVNIDASLTGATQLAGCSIFTKDPNQGGQGQQQAPITVGGDMSGLNPGETVTMFMHDASSEATIDSIVVSANGPYNFNVLPSPGQEIFVGSDNPFCSIANSFQTFNGVTIDNMDVTCSSPVTISGTVTGLGLESPLTLFLRENGGPATFDSVQVSSNGAWFFDDMPPVGTDFFVSNSSCPMVNNTGTFNGQSISGIEVNCPLSISVTLTGLLAITGPVVDLVLTVNGGPVTASFNGLTADGVFHFFTRDGEIPLESGDNFAVTASGFEFGGEGGALNCVVVNGSGTLADVDVQNVQVTCTPGGGQN